MYSVDIIWWIIMDWDMAFNFAFTVETWFNLAIPSRIWFLNWISCLRLFICPSIHLANIMCPPCAYYVPSPMVTFGGTEMSLDIPFSSYMMLVTPLSVSITVKIRGRVSTWSSDGKSWFPWLPLNTVHLKSYLHTFTINCALLYSTYFSKLMWWDHSKYMIYII